MLPHLFLITKRSMDPKRRRHWYLQMKPEAVSADAEQWAGMYLRNADNEEACWVDLPTYNEDDGSNLPEVDWAQMNKSSTAAAEMLFYDELNSDSDWAGVYAIDARKEYFRFGFPRYVKIETDWEGDIYKKAVAPRFVLARERSGRWCIRRSREMYHVRVKDISFPDGTLHLCDNEGRLLFHIAITPGDSSDNKGNERVMPLCDENTMLNGRLFRAKLGTKSKSRDPCGRVLNDEENNILGRITRLDVRLLRLNTSKQSSISKEVISEVCCDLEENRSHFQSRGEKLREVVGCLSFLLMYRFLRLQWRMKTSSG